MSRLHRITAAFRIFLLLVFAVMPGCGAAELSEPLPLPYRLERYEMHSTLNPKTTWNTVYPVFSGGDPVTKINGSILVSITGIDSTGTRPLPVPVERAAKVFITDFDGYTRDFPEHPLPWVFTSKGSVLCNRSGILTVDISTYTFTGGAHGLSGKSYLVFYSATGDRIALVDVFLPGFEKRLDVLVDSSFRQMRGLSPTDRLDSEQGMLFENVIRHNENFAVTDAGVTFLYNQYEIAPYAVGQIVIELPWEDILPLLRPFFRNQFTGLP